MPVNVTLHCLFYLHATVGKVIVNSEMADINSNCNSAVEASLLGLERLGMLRVLCNEKVKAISTLVISTRFACSTKTYTTVTSCQNAACSSTYFFSE